MRGIGRWNTAISPASLLAFQAYKALKLTVALKAALAPNLYSHCMDRDGSRTFFQSLNMDDRSTMASLLRLQLGIDSNLRLDFVSFNLSEMQA